MQTSINIQYILTYQIPETDPMGVVGKIPPSADMEKFL